MKYLLAFLISFNLYAVCDLKSEANINSCTLSDKKFFKTGKDLTQWKLGKISSLKEKQRINAIKARLTAIGGKFGKYDSFSGIRDNMIKCGYNNSNQAAFAKKLIKPENVFMIDCLELKKSEVDSERLSEENKNSARKEARSRMKSADCNSLSGVLKDMCIILKR